MNTSLVPSLNHLTCSRIVATLFNHLEVHNNFRPKNYEVIRSQVKDAISSLTSSTRLQDKLEMFIDPLVREIENWFCVFELSWYGYDGVMNAVTECVPGCWSSDGTIDREKAVGTIVKNEDLRPVNRFVFACTYCFFDDVLHLWNVLFKIEKAYLRHKSSAIVKLWTEFLDSNSVQDRESFFSWSLGTPLWHSNVFILKKVLQTLSPAEKKQYLMNALTGEEINDDVTRYCLSLVTKDEQEQIFKQRPVTVFRCMLSWPWRNIFFDMADNLWPYLTEQSFCSILEMILNRIRSQERVNMEHVIILKNFYAQSPCHFQSAAKNDSDLIKPLQFVLDFDVSQAFPKEEFGLTFWTDMSDLLPRPRDMTVRRRRRRVFRRYRNMS